MTCEDFIPFIDAYVDQEFDERERAEMEMHLSMCPECRERVEFQIELKDQFKACLQERAPDSLREKIFSELEQQAAASVHEAEQGGPAEVVALPTASDAEPEDNRGWLVRYGWIAAPLAAALAVAILLPSFTVAPAKSGQLPIVEQTVDWHVGNYPIEVTGPEASAVSYWFRNKVDFPVRLPQFAGRDVNLLGGRIAHVRDRRAAYLLYEVDGTRLSVLVFDGDGLTIPSDKIRSVAGRDVALLNSKGYEVAVLQDSGVTYTLTSELPEKQFVSLVSSSLQR